MTYVTVVVPTHDRPAALDRCLRALARQDLGSDRPFDVVVAADGGGAEADAVVARHRATGLHVRLVRQPHRGPAAARNRAAGVATGRWLAFTDDDCAPRPAWLSTLTAALERAPDAVVGGRVHNGHPDQAAAVAAHVVLDMLADQIIRADAPAAFLPTSTLALANSAFQQLGGFNEAFRWPGGEDRELCLRARDAGRPIIFVDAAGVDHFHPMGSRELWRQQRTYGRGAAVLVAQRMAAGHRFPRVLLSLYLALARAALTHRPRRQAPAVAANVALTQVAYLYGFARQAAPRPRSRHHQRGR